MGLPLGVLRCGYTSSDVEHPDRQRWEDAVVYAKEIRRSTKMVVIIDREGDSASLMERCLRGGRVDVLVRAMHNRICQTGKNYLGSSEAGVGWPDEMPIQRLSRRVKSGRVLNRDGRVALMEIRFSRVDLPCGVMTAIQIGDSDALEWFLLTSLPVRTFDEAKQVVEYYLLRWWIEDLFRVLKNGCKVEDLRLRSATKLHRAVTINMVMAWPAL